MNRFAGWSVAYRVTTGLKRKILVVLAVPLLLVVGAGMAFGVTAVFDPATALRGVELIKGYLLENVLPAGAKPQAYAVRDTRLLQALHSAALASLAEDRLLADELAINISPSTAFHSMPIPPLVGRQGGRSALGPERDTPKPTVPMPYLHKNVDLGRFASGYVGAPSGSGGFGSASSSPSSGGRAMGAVKVSYVPIQYVNIEYTPVPVPGSATVLACSLLALAGFRLAGRGGTRPAAG